MDQCLSEQARSCWRSSRDEGAQPPRRLQGPGDLGRLCGIHGRRHRRQSAACRGADSQNVSAAGCRSMGAGARDRLFGPSGVESAAAQVRRTDAVAAGHDRQVSHWQLPTLYQVSFDTKSSTWDTVRSYVTFSKQLEKEVALEPGPELLDTYWGVYFANATYRPIS